MPPDPHASDTFWDEDDSDPWWDLQTNGFPKRPGPIGVGNDYLDLTDGVGDAPFED